MLTVPWFYAYLAALPLSVGVLLPSFTRASGRTSPIAKYPSLPRALPLAFRVHAGVCDCRLWDKHLSHRDHHSLLFDDRHLPPICSGPDLRVFWWERQPSRTPILHSRRSPSSPRVSGLQKTLTATIPSPHSIAAILSPSVPPEEVTNGTSRSSTPKRTHAEAFSADQAAYLHPASPTQHRASLASIGDANPGNRGPDDGGIGGLRGGQEEKKPAKMVRSSIACARCRRSKVKCVNTGINSTCKACLSSNRECTYPVAGSMPTPKRNDANAGIKQEEGESKKRIKKVEDIGRRNSTKSGEDALDSPILTRKVWDEIYSIFKLHFSTEMPFLHPPTFKNRMRQASYPRDPSAPAVDLRDGRVLLLGVLTLTARFHKDLVAHHSPSSNPLAASEYYAAHLAAAFGPTPGNLTNPSLEVIQAFLMLGLYEWGQTRGLSAWVYVGIATRLAQSMGLPYEDDTGPSVKYPTHESQKAPETKTPMSPGEELTEKEVRRRTWWSCFIMDRMLSAGKCRPTMIDVEVLRVQLPCSDKKFLFQENVKTPFLKSGSLRGNKVEETGNDEGVLGWYIRLVEIFGRFSKWSYAGGRRIETLPPWDPSTEFYQLRQELVQFQRALPSNLAFSKANLSAHIEERNATAYASMHTLYYLCLIMLHREYIPFIPLRCSKPCGPLDEPTFPPEKYNVPERFWEDSAERIFAAAKDIIDIVRTCQDDDALPESPQIGFAVYQAAFICVYSAHFNHMDQAKFVYNSDVGTGPDIRHKGYLGLTGRVLADMATRLKMAKVYQTTIKKMFYYFMRVGEEYRSHSANKSQPLMWTGGGGLDQYKEFEKDLKEFGILIDTDKAHSDGSSDIADTTRSRASTNDINGEPMQGVESGSASRTNGTGGAFFTAVNAQTQVETDDRSTKYNQQYPYGQPPHAYPNQHSPSQSNASSMISPSNGDSTPGISSPFTAPQVLRQQYNPNQPPVSTYASIAQHAQPVMAPPNTQVVHQWTYEEENRHMKPHEAMPWNTDLDSFSQGLPANFGPWMQNGFPPNYVQPENWAEQVQIPPPITQATSWS
ncbi:fungal-specific transcription factor domain-containing protein [Tricladium varicosporioides]|nr:fungal-specific transcription factor domain-containing protein [Hymenoscyphus varicosporioides]